MYSINFTKKKKKKISLSSHFRKGNGYLIVNGTEVHKFKPKDSEMLADSLSFGNNSKDW